MGRGILCRVVVVKFFLRVLQNTLRVRRSVKRSRSNCYLGRPIVRFANDGVIGSDGTVLICTLHYCVDPGDVCKGGDLQVVTIRGLRANTWPIRFFFNEGVFYVEAQEVDTCVSGDDTFVGSLSNPNDGVFFNLRPTANVGEVEDCVRGARCLQGKRVGRLPFCVCVGEEHEFRR